VISRKTQQQQNETRSSLRRSSLTFRSGSDNDNEFDRTASGHLLSNTPAELVNHSLLERKIAAALRARAKSSNRSSAARIKSVNALLMKLPKIRAGFECARDTFNEIDTDHNGTLDLAELSAGCRQLGFVTGDTLLRDVFHESDMDRGRTLQFREFLIALALLHLLTSPEDTPAEVNSAFETMQEAFFFFDDSGDGFLQKDEVLLGLVDPEDKKKDRKGSFKLKSDGTGGSPALESLGKRFYEMDCDQSGVVTYNEFFYAVQSWLGMDDNDSPADTDD